MNGECLDPCRRGRSVLTVTRFGAGGPVVDERDGSEEWRVGRFDPTRRVL